MNFNKLLFLLICTLVSAFVQAQPRINPKPIKAKGDYLHPSAKTLFPVHFNGMVRKNIYSFDKQNKNIGVVYESEENGKKTTLSLYVYPADAGAEDRLRGEYLSSMQSMANFTKGDGIHATQFAVRHEGPQYICNGFKAIVKPGNASYSEMSVYECGTWFFKLRLSSNSADSSQAAAIEQKVLEQFDPSSLTTLQPLDTLVSVYFAKAAFRDSTMLGCSMGSAYEKIGWAYDNVPENERVSGFPDMHLNMHVEALKAFVKFDKEKNFSKNEATQQYLAELNAIIDAGFLTEFILDNYSMIMIIPENTKADFDGYNKWKSIHKPTIDLNNRFYVVSYKQRKKGA